MKREKTHYIVCNRVFETFEEAKALADYISKETGVFVAIEATARKVTHVFHDQAN